MRGVEEIFSNFFIERPRRRWGDNIKIDLEGIRV
jgi:hypothetical protein